MRQFYLLSSSICFLLALLTSPANGTLIMQNVADLVNSTCKQCADQSNTSSYNFCVNSLGAISISHSVNLPGLAIVAMELSLDNATSTIVTINKMIASHAPFDPFLKECLEECLELYQETVSKVENAITVFLSDHFAAADAFMSAAMTNAATCEDGFTEKGGKETPLIKENDDLFELSSISVCIVELVSNSSKSIHHGPL